MGPGHGFEFCWVLTPRRIIWAICLASQHTHLHLCPLCESPEEGPWGRWEVGSQAVCGGGTEWSGLSGGRRKQKDKHREGGARCWASDPSPTRKELTKPAGYHPPQPPPDPGCLQIPSLHPWHTAAWAWKGPSCMPWAIQPIPGLSTLSCNCLVTGLSGPQVPHLQNGAWGTACLVGC